MAQEIPMPEMQPPMDQEQPMDGLISKEAEPMTSDSLEMDEGEANKMANQMILAQKERIYGAQFDPIMETLQGSENLPQDIALILANLVATDMASINAAEKTVPYDFLMDVAAESCSEIYDCAIQTGVYQPGSEEELVRNQNISLTMAVGELAKDMGGKDMLPREGVEGFIDSVMNGDYDEQGMQQPEAMAQPAPQMPVLPPQGAL